MLLFEIGRMVVITRLISYSENNYSYCAAGAGWSLAEIGKRYFPDR